MDQSHLFVSPTHSSSDFHQQSQSGLMPVINHSNTQSPCSADSPSLAATPTTNTADIVPALGSQQQYQSASHQLHQQQTSYGDAVSSSSQQQQLPHYSQLLPTPSLPQSAYTSAFSSATSSTSSQQQQQQSGHNASALYQTPPQSHHPSAQYVPHDQNSALAPLQFGHIGVIGHQRPPATFPYEFDPSSDTACRNMYTSADIDSQVPSHQLSNAGYLRHSNTIPVAHSQTPSASSQQSQPMSASHGHQSLDMAASAGIALAADMAAEQGGQSQHTHQHVSGMHSAASQSSFGGSSVSNQPIFTTLSFQNSQLQEYDPYTRPQKRASRATKPKRTPRPPNAFILYRKAKQAEVIRDHPGVSNKDVSCIIGQMWKSEEPHVQDKFREQAEVEKKKHKDQYPNYKYQPRKPKNKRMLDSQGGASTPTGNAMVQGAGQDNGTFSPGGSASGMSSGLKDNGSAAAAAANAAYPSYSNKYHLMMQQGQGQQQHSPAHSQTPTSQQQQQAQLPRAEEYYYRGPGSMSEAHHQHSNGGFVSQQLDIKPGFVNAIPTAYWTPATPSDAAFSNTLPSANVFHGGDPAAAHMRPFDSMVPQHPGGGHSMGAPSAHIFNSFDHQRQMQHHHHQQQVHDSMDYQAAQQQQYHQHHSHSQQHQQSQQHQPHPATALGGYVGGGQAYHHSQHGIDGLDGSSVAGADSQGLGLLSPPAVAWSTNM
ncbi:slightly ste11-like protein [Coemansia aciculifera]|nr:slightly ste11-like protein [Coemansia aciculifera]